MKKLFVLVITLTTALAAHAQVSVQVGYLSNTLKAENKEVGKLAGTYRGVTAAVDYNVHLTDYLGVAPGLGVDYSFNNNSGLKYQELGLFAPIDVNYCLSQNSSFSLSLFAGPTLYYGIFSRETYDNKTYDNYAENYSKRFDVSLGGGFWLDFNEMIRFKLGYKFGLTNTSKIDGITERNNFLSISVGYVF